MSRLSKISQGLIDRPSRTLQSKRLMLRRLCQESLEDRKMLAVNVLLPGVDWTEVGPAPIFGGQVEGLQAQNSAVSGAIHDIAPHPAKADVLYAASVNGGLWKTNNATSAAPVWTNLSDGFDSLSFSSIEFDSADPFHQTLVAGAGRYSAAANDGGLLNGLVRTTDGGNSWTAIGKDIFNGQNISALTVHGPIIVVATDSVIGQFGTGGLYRTLDFGSTWEEVSGLPFRGLPEGSVTDLVRDPLAPSILYASIVGPSAGIFRSADFGASWQDVSDTFGDVPATALVAGELRDAAGNLNVGVTVNIKLATHHSPFGVALYAGIVNFQDANIRSQLVSVFRSDTLGTLWQDLGAPVTIEGADVVGLHPATPKSGPGGQGNVHFSIGADPHNPHIVYVGGDRQDKIDFVAGTPNSIGAFNFTGRLFRGDAREQAADIWTPLTHNFADADGAGPALGTAPHADSRRIAFDADGNLVEADDGGVYRRLNPQSSTGTWVSAIGDLRVTEFYSVDFDNRTDLFSGGTQDNGNNTGPFAGNVWQNVSQGDGFTVRIDDSGANSIRYISAFNLLGFRRQTLDAAGAVTADAAVGLVVAGSGGQTLQQVDANVRFNQPWELNAIDPLRMVIGTGSLYESADQGNNLTDITGFTGAFINGLAYGGVTGGLANADLLYFGSGNNLFVRTAAGVAPAITAAPFPGTNVKDITLDPADGLRAFVLDDSGRVFLTPDGGASWVDLTGNLQDARARSIALLPTAAGNALLVGGLGVSTMLLNSPGGWFNIGTALPNVLVNDLIYDAADDVLLASTFGRGAWAIPGAAAAVAAAGTGTLHVTGDDGLSVTNDLIHLLAQAGGTVLDVFVNGVLQASVPTGTFDHIVVEGRGGDDRLTVDFANGLFIPANGLDFFGGDNTVLGQVLGDDGLIVQGGAFLTSTTTVTGPGSGRVTLSDATSASTIRFFGLEPVWDLTNADIKTFSSEIPGRQVIQVLDDGDPADNLSTIKSGIFGAFETLIFSTPNFGASILTGDGDDVVEVISTDANFNRDLFIFGDSGNDVITAAPYSKSVTIDGDLGNDTIVGSQGNDTLFGWDGNDVIDGQLGDDDVFGEDGNDTVVGGPGDDLVEGGLGNDIVEGGGGNDAVYQDFAPVPAPASAGLFNAASGEVFLRNSPTSGIADRQFVFGAGGGTQIGLVGDWNGDGIDTFGVYDTATGLVFLQNGNTTGFAEVTYQYGAGNSGLVPVVGDWNGDGIDTLALYSSADGCFLIRNSHTTGDANSAVFFGPGSSKLQPLAGDWNSDGTYSPGLYDPQSGLFHLRNSNSFGFADVTLQFGNGGANLSAVTGDWLGNGTTTVGLYDRGTGNFLLRNSLTTGIADHTFQFGVGGNQLLPLVGNWVAPTREQIRSAPAAAGALFSGQQALVAATPARASLVQQALSGDDLSASAQAADIALAQAVQDHLAKRTGSSQSRLSEALATARRAARDAALADELLTIDLA